MKLNEHEEAMRRGEDGPAVAEAIEQQIKVGEFFGAERFVPVTNVHMMGDIEVMGDSGLRFLEHNCELAASCRGRVSTNARCMDFSYAARLGQSSEAVAKERAIVAALRRMKIATVDTCINYQTLYQPHFGEHVAWGDTGTVIYANSVFGARSNFESGPAAFAAALTGRTPAYGFHLDEHRRGGLHVQVKARLDDLADWGAVGKIIGAPVQDYYAVPVLEGIETTPTADALKHLGCSLASYGSIAMYHLVGVTPEAPSAAAAFGARQPKRMMDVTDEAIEGVYRAYDVKDGRADLVVFSGPQLSLFEIQTLAELFAGRRVHSDTQVFLTTNHAIASDARRLGYLDVLETSGVQIMEGVCFYILEDLSGIRMRNNWTNLVSNSAKIVNTITAHRFNTILRRTRDCVEAAVTGRVVHVH